MLAFVTVLLIAVTTLAACGLNVRRANDPTLWSGHLTRILIIVPCGVAAIALASVTGNVLLSVARVPLGAMVLLACWFLTRATTLAAPAARPQRVASK